MYLSRHIEDHARSWGSWHSRRIYELHVLFIIKPAKTKINLLPFSSRRFKASRKGSTNSPRYRFGISSSSNSFNLPHTYSISPLNKRKMPVVLVNETKREAEPSGLACEFPDDLNCIFGMIFNLNKACLRRQSVYCISGGHVLFFTLTSSR